MSFNSLPIADPRYYSANDHTIFGGDREPEWLRRAAEQERIFADIRTEQRVAELTGRLQRRPNAVRRLFAPRQGA
ncbi:MAG: hypothetical protein ACKVT1_16300 [Dehalococcoidia bacterium]